MNGKPAEHSQSPNHVVAASFGTRCRGPRRREVLQWGAAGSLGLTLPVLKSARAEAEASTRPLQSSFGRAKSVICIWLLGGPPQHETWDPKPRAPQEIRGPFGAISSAVPGFQTGELMPRTAKLTKQIAALRAVVTGDNAHSSSGYQMLTGVPHQPLNQENATAKAPNRWPSVPSIVRMLKGDQHGIPAAVALPRHIANDGEIVWPGQDAGFLSRKFDPWLLTCDPNDAEFSVPDLTLPEEISTQRFRRRRELLQEFNRRRQHSAVATAAPMDRFAEQSRQAFDLLTGAAARKAFRIHDETASTRDAYGRTRFGQSLLLARRLVEAGVSLVQVNWTRIPKTENNGTWDIHKSYPDPLKNVLMPIMDQAYSTLLSDLDERGLLDETLVCWLGEFGHTPKINARGGRDHWGRCFSVALSGGPISGGVIHGRSDQHAAAPVSGRVEPRDIAATIFHALGISPETVMHDHLGRPLPVSRGRVIDEILA